VGNDHRRFRTAKELSIETGIPERSILRGARDGAYESVCLRRRIYIDRADFFAKISIRPNDHHRGG
jgi:hypothetical protein